LSGQETAKLHPKDNFFRLSKVQVPALGLPEKRRSPYVSQKYYH
jgi:hypothetical protein